MKGVSEDNTLWQHSWKTGQPEVPSLCPVKTKTNKQTKATKHI